MFLPFCSKVKEEVQPINTTANLTINVADDNGFDKYSAQDKYPILIENSSGSFKTQSEGLYFSGAVPKGDIQVLINDSGWFYGDRAQLTITKDTTITLLISAGYRWRKSAL